MLLRTLVTLVLLVGGLAGSSGAATGSPAAQALAHLQAFDESLANLQVDLTAPLVVTTQTPQRLNGLGSLIAETLPLVKKGFPGASAALMLGQVKKIQSGLAAAAKAQGAAQVRDLAGIAAAEAPLEAAVAIAAAVPGGTAPLVMARGATDFGTQTTGSLTIRTETFENPLLFPVKIAAGVRIIEGTVGSLVQTAPGAFNISKDGCSGVSLAPLGSCKVTISFQPTSVGPATGTLQLADNAPLRPTQSFALTGVGTASGTAKLVVKTGGSATPLTPGTPLLFPERTSLSSFATAGERVQAIQLINVGTASATLADVAVEGPDAHDFIVSHGCDDATLAPGTLQQPTAASECYVSVEVRAGRYTTPLNAHLVVGGSHTGGLAPIKLGLTDADLALTALAATPLHPVAGGRWSVTVGVANSGPDAADRVEVDAKLTAGSGTLRLVDSVPEGCLYDPPSGILTCPVGTLPPDAKTPITAVFRLPKASGHVAADVTVQSLDFDPTPGNDAKTLAP